MGQTDRLDVDILERNRNLAKKGKITKGSRHSDKVRAVAESYREEYEMSMYDDTNYIEPDYLDTDIKYLDDEYWDEKADAVSFWDSFQEM